MNLGNRRERSVYVLPDFVRKHCAIKLGPIRISAYLGWTPVVVYADNNIATGITIKHGHGVLDEIELVNLL